MRIHFMITAVLIAATALAACQRTEEAPPAAPSDVSAAPPKAIAPDSAAGRAVEHEGRNAGPVPFSPEAESTYAVAMERITAEYDIATRKCVALAGPTQVECRRQADTRRGIASEQARHLGDHQTN